jgi:hypothetical protein
MLLPFWFALIEDEAKITSKRARKTLWHIIEEYTFKNEGKFGNNRCSFFYISYYSFLNYKSFLFLLQLLCHILYILPT